jgi:hypothetical protein
LRRGEVGSYFSRAYIVMSLANGHIRFRSAAGFVGQGGRVFFGEDFQLLFVAGRAGAMAEAGARPVINIRIDVLPVIRAIMDAAARAGASTRDGRGACWFPSPV